MPLPLVREHSRGAAADRPSFARPAVAGILGLDVCAQTPVELLHTFLLGPVQYAWAATVKQLGDEGGDYLLMNLEAVDTVTASVASRLVSHHA